MGELALNSTTNPMHTSAATQMTMTLAGVIVRGRRETAALGELTMVPVVYFLGAWSATGVSTLMVGTSVPAAFRPESRS